MLLFSNVVVFDESLTRPRPVGKVESLLKKRRVEKLVDQSFHNTLRIVNKKRPTTWIVAT